VDFFTSNSSKDDKSVRISASVRIGVTGHRQLVTERLLRNGVKKILTRFDDILNQTRTPSWQFQRWPKALTGSL